MPQKIKLNNVVVSDQDIAGRANTGGVPKAKGPAILCEAEPKAERGASILL